MVDSTHCGCYNTIIMKQRGQDMTTDLFETPELIPQELAAVFDRFADDLENGDPYFVLEDMLAEIKPLGYTFDFGLDGVAYDLREISG